MDILLLNLSTRNFIFISSLRPLNGLRGEPGADTNRFQRPMSRVLIYYAHPGHRHSHANKALVAAAQTIPDITFVDLYAEYPRFHIDIDKEQRRLIAHDIYVFQHPLFWYSTPALLKEWVDLVLEHGFAYGSGGDKLSGKTLMQVVSAAGPVDAYSAQGYQRYPLRTFLTPMEQTAHLCNARYAPPYVLYSSLTAPSTGALKSHVEGYKRLLIALRDNTYDFDQATSLDVVHHNTLPIRREG